MDGQEFVIFCNCCLALSANIFISCVVLVRDLAASHLEACVLFSNSLAVLKALETRTGKFGNNVDPDEVAHNEPPHLDLQCLSSRL